MEDAMSSPNHRLSRRRFLRCSGLAVVALTLPATRPTAGAAEPAADGKAPAPDAEAVLARLVEGNRRFVRGEPLHPRRRPEDFRPLAEAQSPVAAIVGCADSRVPPELIFDQGVGDLFVVRVAGNVVSGAGATVKGSIEYAVAELGVPLVLVLGHSRCGAVKAAIKHLEAHDALSGALGDLVNTIKPAVSEAKGKAGDLLDNAIKANVERGVARLRGLEPVLAEPARKGKVKVVGAVYDLATGKVQLLA
jgi:carbonic anhydrase